MCCNFLNKNLVNELARNKICSIIKQLSKMEIIFNFFALEKLSKKTKNCLFSRKKSSLLSDNASNRLTIEHVWLQNSSTFVMP